MSFEKLNIKSDLLQALKKLNFTKPTPIQKEAIVAILEKKDIVAKAKTGSGKTLAYTLPILNSLEKTLIVVPTRELANQILKTFKDLNNSVKIVSIIGGVALSSQEATLKQGVELIIATPGRLIDFINRDKSLLNGIKRVVLDEADKMLEMGFLEDIEYILKNINNIEQILLFSATYPKDLQKFAKKILKNPQIIEVGEDRNSNIKELAFLVENKKEALISILEGIKPKRVIVFANTKRSSEELSDFLYDRGFDVAVFNGNLEQYKREEVLLKFKNGTLPIMVATDIAARGLDVESIDLVVNYELAMKSKEYIHRIGRTARGAKEGLALSLLESREIEHLKILTDILPKEYTFKKSNFFMQGEMNTLVIEGGKSKKIRAGDILGVLCKEFNLDSNDIRNIDILPKYAYVAIKKDAINPLVGKKSIVIKKKKCRVWID